MATPTQLETLRKALSFDRPPLCSGAISPPPEGLYLYHGKNNAKCVRFSSRPSLPVVDPVFRFIDFASATPEDLDLLTTACDPATFGRGKEDVYDESYRKAVKMDTSNFSIQFDPGASGLIQIIEDQLLQGETEKMHIKAELYKLNVYGNIYPPHLPLLSFPDTFSSI
jgi:hypothetical protein